MPYGAGAPYEGGSKEAFRGDPKLAAPRIWVNLGKKFVLQKRMFIAYADEGLAATRSVARLA